MPIESSIYVSLHIQTDVAEFMRIFVGSEFPHKTQVDKVVGPNPEGRARVRLTLNVSKNGQYREIVRQNLGQTKSNEPG